MSGELGFHLPGRREGEESEEKWDAPGEDGAKPNDDADCFHEVPAMTMMQHSSVLCDSVTFKLPQLQPASPPV